MNEARLHSGGQTCCQYLHLYHLSELIETMLSDSSPGMTVAIMPILPLQILSNFVISLCHLEDVHIYLDDAQGLFTSFKTSFREPQEWHRNRTQSAKSKLIRSSVVDKDDSARVLECSGDQGRLKE